MISSKITLKQLEALIWVANLQSFRKAATHLRTTQPNISARIAGLEAALGQTLLTRDGGAVHPTGEGFPVLEAARKAVTAAEAVLTAANRTDLIDTPLRLGVTEMVASTWLRSYLRALSDRYPQVSVDLTVDLSQVLGQALVAHDLDLAIQTAPFDGTGAEEIVLGTYPYVWAAAPGQGSEQALDLAALARSGILTHAKHTNAVRALEAELKARRIADARIIRRGARVDPPGGATERLPAMQSHDHRVRRAHDEATKPGLEDGWIGFDPLDRWRHGCERAPQVLRPSC